MMAERTKGLVDGHFGNLYRDYFLPLSEERDNELRPRNLGYNSDESDEAETPIRLAEWSYS